MLVKYDDLQAGDFFKVYEDGVVYQKIMYDGVYRFICLGVVQISHKPHKNYVYKCDRDGNPIKIMKSYSAIKNGEWFLSENNGVFLKVWNGGFCFGTEKEPKLGAINTFSTTEKYEIINKPDWVKLP